MTDRQNPMSSDLPVPMRRAQDMMVLTPPPAPAPEEADFDLHRKAHRALRGNYKWAVLFGAIFAVAGGWFGYHSDHPEYRTEGLIRIAYERPVVLNTTEMSK